MILENVFLLFSCGKCKKLPETPKGKEQKANPRYIPRKISER